MSAPTPSLTASLRRAIELASFGLPDPMHPGMPPQFVDGLVAAQIVLANAVDVEDVGDVDAATRTLEALEARYV